MDQARIQQAVALIADNRQTPAAFDGLPEALRPVDEVEGYAIQRALAHHLSDGGMGPVIGAKIGCTTSVMQAYMKIGSPCADTVHGGGVHHDWAELRFADYHHVGVECEIAVRLADDLPLSNRRLRSDDVAEFVDAFLPAIEIVDDRYRDFRAIDTPTLIADDFFHAGCVLGEPVADWRGIDLAAVGGTMRIDGETVGSGRCGDILGHPLEALAWLANAQVSQGRRLPAGSVILLGSVVETRWLSQGNRVDIEIEGLGRVGARF